jgi:hypothetical protein
MISFETAVYEASQVITNDKTRYDLGYIKIEDYKVAATDGKRLYVAYIENKPPVTGFIKLAQIKGGRHQYPRPKQSGVGKGYKLVETDGRKYLDMLGTRFEVASGEVSFPPYEKVIPAQSELILLDSPQNFADALRSLREYGRDMSQAYLFHTGEKASPKYRAVMYKNGALHLVTECCYEEHGNFIPVAHTKLANMSQPSADHQLVVFNPDLYAMRCAPVAIGLTGSKGPIIFEYPGRRLVVMPIHSEKDDGTLEHVENFLCWEYEECEVG